MDTEHQHKTLLTAFRDKGALAQIDPLATPNVLRIADADGKRALCWALEHHNDPEVIMLVISRDPEALVSVVGGVRVWEWFNSMSAENRFSNHADIHRLLAHSYNSYREHRFPRLIELCGTSDALEALVAAHDEDDLSLRVLCLRSSWSMVLVRIKHLPVKAAVAELFSLDEIGRSAFAIASVEAAPVEVLESLLILSKLDAKKRNILGIADIDLCLPLHNTARWHPNPAAIKLLARHHPQALLVKSKECGTPMDYAVQLNDGNPAVVSLVRELTAARLATIALRTTLLLCIKHGYVYVRRSKRQRTETVALDTQLAFEVLNDNVLSHIMTFL